jgi:hypothetical protein
MQMMSEAKPLASLSSSLLARKGHARPAMRPQAMIVDRDAAQSLEDLGWNDMGDDIDEAHRLQISTVSSLTPMAANSPAHEQQEELAQALEQSFGFQAEAMGDNDDDDDPVAVDDHTTELPHAFHHKVVSPPILSPVAETVMHFPVVTPQANVAPRAAPGSKGKSAFTLRLDPDRHMRLRVHCAISHRSAQQVVTAALDEFLARQPTIQHLSQTAPAA